MTEPVKSVADSDPAPIRRVPSKKKSLMPLAGKSGLRLPSQIFSLILFNSYFLAPWGKRFCLPVLNCYSCPVGTVACPIGTITGFAIVRRIPFFVIGTLGLIALAVGRAFCGWACPFGLLQDILYRIRTWKWRMPRFFNWLKYALLLVLVIALPLMLMGGKKAGAGDRITGEATGAYDYCSLICPAGTLEAGIPTMVMYPEVRKAASWRTWSKVGLLVAMLGLIVVSRRAFCRALCPLGALMALGSKISMLRLRTDNVKCTRCMRCVKLCPTGARKVPHGEDATESSSECVLCLDCVRNCPEAGALEARFANYCVSCSKGKAS